MKYRKPGSVREDEQDLSKMSGSRLVDRYSELMSLAGTSSEVKDIIQAIGYSNLEDFFGDNPGAIDVIAGWIGRAVDKVPEWRSKLIQAIKAESK